MQGTDEKDAYEWLVYDWGDAYAISYDDTPRIAEPYAARRRDDLSVVVTAADPDKLADMLCDNYLERPVPRDAAP